VLSITTTPLTETRYLVPAGADWAVWDDVNGVLGFMTDAQAVETSSETGRPEARIFAFSAAMSCSPISG